MSASIIDAASTSGQRLNLPAANYPFDLDADAVMNLIPHRGDILFASHIRVLARDHYVGFATWGLSSMGISGHFPGLPIVPAVYLIEAAAQVAGAGMLASAQRDDEATSGRIGVLAGVRRCAFKKPVFPGQRVKFDLTVNQGSGGFAFVTGNAESEEGQVAALDFIVAFAMRSQIFPGD